jgi:polysaccharide deacetylase family protein (PEP-CTERM system associated)
MNILTLDLEDWFHLIDIPAAATVNSWDSFESRVEANTDRILQLLDEKKISATWFCLGWIAKKYPALVKKISRDHELGIHSMYHELLFRTDRQKTSADITDNIKLVEDITGRKVLSYRAPGFSFDHRSKWLVKVLNEAGIVYDCSVFPAKRNHGGFKKFPQSGPCIIEYKGGTIKELPMTTGRFLGKKIVFSGGGYFRFLPYSTIHNMMLNSEYNMTYFHPRDFDSGQPVLPGMSMRRKFMSYTGLKNSFSKFNRLLNDHKFVSVGEGGTKVNWLQTPLVKLGDL